MFERARMASTGVVRRVLLEYHSELQRSTSTQKPTSLWHAEAVEAVADAEASSAARQEAGRVDRYAT
jgi:hypothetical protein